MAAVQEMARLQRLLFELEREFLCAATTLIYRLGTPELKYLLCQHVWESAGHARFLRERGREMSGFGSGESVRPQIRRLFNEAILPENAEVALAGFYGAIKPALLEAYRYYLSATHHLADWPSRKLVEEFIGDEERHALEIAPFLTASQAAADWTQPGRALRFLMKLLNRFWNGLRLVNETSGGGGSTRGGYRLVKCQLASVSICCKRLV
jgi:hypothetical protein